MMLQYEAVYRYKKRNFFSPRTRNFWRTRAFTLGSVGVLWSLWDVLRYALDPLCASVSYGKATVPSRTRSRTFTAVFHEQCGIIIMIIITTQQCPYRRCDVTAAPFFFLTWDERFENWSLVQMEHALLSRYKWTTDKELYCFGSLFLCHMKAFYPPVMWVTWEEGLHFPLFFSLHIFTLRKRFFAYLCSACWKPHAEASALA